MNFILESCDDDLPILGRESVLTRVPRFEFDKARFQLIQSFHRTPPEYPHLIRFFVEIIGWILTLWRQGIIAYADRADRLNLDRETAY